MILTTYMHAQFLNGLQSDAANQSSISTFTKKSSLIKVGHDEFSHSAKKGKGEVEVSSKCNEVPEMS